ADKKSIFKSVKETLCQMTIKGGRNTEKDIFGVSGGYQTILSKNTWKASCPICGSEIVKQTYLGGTVYYCPVCQPFVKYS
ncbi:MAG: endonuclease VIII, partial [Eubacterium sp.]